MDQNMLTGSIPESICKLSKLGRLYLSDNNISGVIPACISNITEIFLLSFANNMLYGSIPTSLFNISSLQDLYLENNHLSGVIPKHIIGLSSQCRILYLDQNLLTGPLPSNIGSLIHLLELTFSQNKVTGEIPDSLGNCVMEYLYMDNNFLEGNIPHFLGELSLINFLHLSHNKLGDEVPRKGLFSNVSAFSVIGNINLCGGIQSLELPACPENISRTRKKQFPVRIIPLLVLLPFAALLACLALIFYRHRKSRQMNVPVLELLDNQYPRLSYKDLLLATNEFSLNNLLGEGRYGSVYKGILQSLQLTVAIKVMNIKVHGAHKNFLEECETLKNIHHRNLIKIITACSSTDYRGNDFKALVLEFMANGNLDNWLHPSLSDQGNERNLTLLQRLNIAIDVALAVDYLHHHSHTKIIHRDIKPSNILLDEEFVAHVSDFGLSRFLLTSTGDINQVQTSSTGVRGTVGCVPPEYGMISAEGDVYSYGILVLEMFSGQRHTCSSILMDHANNLHDYVRKALPHRVMEIADPRVILQQKESGSLEDESISRNSKSNKIEVCLASIFEIGVLCSVERPRERMGINVAIKHLHVARDKLLQCGQ